MVDTVKEYYKNILHQRSDSQKIINVALEVVQQFIIDRRRIMVGGMMIDMALKLKGDEIYGPDVLPDYDFYSPNHFRDAYDLGEILCKNGFKQISVIPARHITTMKVRVDFEVVADITYCPQNIYDKLPTLQYNKFIIRHPHVQMIDQHLALSNPFTNPGQEVIFERWKKDCVRYDALYKHYPVENPDQKEMPSSKHAFHTVTIDKELLKDNCIAGFAAFQIWCDASENKTPIVVPTSISVPKWAPITILTQNIEKYGCSSVSGGEIRCYNQYFDHIPKRVIFKRNGVTYEMLDTRGMKISATNCVCGLQYVMVYLLSQFVYSIDENATIYARYCYNKCRNIIEQSYNLPQERAKLFLPNISVYGNTIESPSTVVYNEMFKAHIDGTKRPTSDTPRSAYPRYPQCMIDATFDISKSKYFDIGGQQVNEFRF